LSKSGELDNTVIVFTSDNGFLNGEHRIPLGKERVYEPSTRVPLVIRGPGIAPGLRLRQPVANIDLAPTIVDAAGARAGIVMDGRSLWPLFADPGIFFGRYLLHEGPLNDEAYSKFSALRTSRWLYAQYATGADELYDLELDPYELTNLRGAPEAAALRKSFRDRLLALATCAGPTCRLTPDLSVTGQVAGDCPEATATVSLGGADLPAVTRVRLSYGSEVVELTAAPWELVRPLGPDSTPVRAHFLLADGLELTRDLILPACVPGTSG
jgi:hypothetical protein